MKPFHHFGTILFASFGSAANGTYHQHAIRVLSSAESVNSTVYLTTVPSAAPSAPSATALDSSVSYLSSNSATESDSSTLPDNSQQEEQHTVQGMNLFQTCAAVIFAATILGLFGHIGMKLLPIRFREDNSQNELHLEDTLASSPSPRNPVFSSRNPVIKLDV